MNVFKELIPELQDWNNGAGIDIESWIGSVGDFRKAIGYSVLFWPEFVEYNGFVLRENFDKESLEQFLIQYKNERAAVESVMNHLHIIDMQYVGCPDASKERILYLGRILKEIYECKLKYQFSDRSFEVQFNEDGPGLNDYQLTFFQKSH